VENEINDVGAGSPTSVPPNRYPRKPAPSPPTSRYRQGTEDTKRVIFQSLWRE